MRRKVAKDLDFSSEKKKKSKQLRYFLLSFSVFVIVLGTISLLMFMKSLDFDLNNLGRSNDQTTTELSTESTTQEVRMTGQSNIVLLCSGADNSVSFSCLVKSDMAKKTIKVYYLPAETQSNSNNITATLNEQYQKFGATGFTRAVEGLSGITVDRYIKVNETQFKAFLNKCGDVVVNIPTAINSTSAGGLYLDAGQQSLSGDLFVKYMKYCDDSQKSQALADFIKTVLSQSNIKSQSTLYSYLANNSDTNVSIVDFTETKEQINAFILGNGSVNAVSSFAELGEG